MSATPAPAPSTHGGSDLAGLEFAPGTNPRGDLSLADWRFLLPRLAYHRVLFLGAPAPAAAAALARTCRETLIVSDDHTALTRLHVEARARAITNLLAVRILSPEALPCADQSVDLVVLCDPRTTARTLTSWRAIEELSRVLAPDSVVYLELTRHIDLVRARRLIGRLRQARFSAPQSYWLLRHRQGGVRMAFPLERATAVQYAFDHVLYGNSRRAEALRLAGRLASRSHLHRLAVPGRAMVFERSRQSGTPSPVASGPSAYLGELAAEAGVTLRPSLPGFFARGSYDSNKVAFFLFENEGCTPDVLVKLTRGARYNHRLEREGSALAELQARGLADPGTYPEMLFQGRHHDLAVLAQRVVPGSPFRGRTRGEATCPLAKSAIAWIEELGARSAALSPDPQLLVRMLERLQDRYEQVYAPPAAERAFVAERLRTVGMCGSAVPLVFQHGDAGTWNVLVTENRGIAFLDWEVSHSRGVPLWDLLDFLRSFGSWGARARGERDLVRAYASDFLGAGQMAAMQAEAVRRYCDRLQLPREAVEALFYTCWMQRAVREAAWSSAPLADGLYVNLVRTCIRERRSVGLRWLFD